MQVSYQNDVNTNERIASKSFGAAQGISKGGLQNFKAAQQSYYHTNRRMKPTKIPGFSVLIKVLLV